jgi:hypothetical protein
MDGWKDGWMDGWKDGAGASCMLMEEGRDTLHDKKIKTTNVWLNSIQ